MIIKNGKNEMKLIKLKDLSIVIATHSSPLSCVVCVIVEAPIRALSSDEVRLMVPEIGANVNDVAAMKLNVENFCLGTFH